MTVVVIIIFYPKKVGKSVESLIAKDETTRLDKITSTILIIGGVSILLLIFGIKQVMPWIKSKLQRNKDQERDPEQHDLEQRDNCKD